MATRRSICELPVWVQGGIGPNTAAACLTGGATGVVLDSQVLLTRESPLPPASRNWLAGMDASQTICVGAGLGACYRVYNRPGSAAVAQLIEDEKRLDASLLSDDERDEAWRRVIRRLAGAQPERDVWLLGQDAALAKQLADRFVTVGGVVSAVRDQAMRNLDTARHFKPLAPGAALAKSHGTRYPIVQGPMTRVSDTPEFANAVGEAGGLPFLALALLGRQDTEKLLEATVRRLGEKSWGVGLLGFLPAEIRKEQIEAVLAHRPNFALIAGGRPDQARELEESGIPTTCMSPSPGLLRMFLRDGDRRFICEGRECGGHVGPRSSFLLWESLCEVLLEHLGENGRGDELHVLFAGGIHDSLSAAMVAALSAPLADRGVAVGVLMGTAYLVTEEAVTTGTVVPRFQQEALSCNETVLLETAPGHAIRCVKTPYCEEFETEKQRLTQEGRDKKDVAARLERLNVGRLRVASKGLDRVSGGSARKLAEIPQEEQYAHGMYMIGQVAALRDRVTTMAELHQDVSVGSTQRLEATAPQVVSKPPQAEPCDVAVIGMSCYFPGTTGC